MNESKDENKNTNNNEKLVIRIDARERALREQNARLEAAEEKGIEQGIAIGTEQGIEKGISIGTEQGIEQGERNKAIEIAKKLKTMKLDINQIIEATGLSKEEIESL